MSSVKKIRSVREAARQRRKVSVRKRISGTPERPRLTVFRSAKHIYAQVVDDTSNSVLAAASDREKDLQAELAGKKKTERAKVIGEAVAKRLLAKNVSAVVFDRNGYLYHGRVSAVAEGARAGGLQF